MATYRSRNRHDERRKRARARVVEEEVDDDELDEDDYDYRPSSQQNLSWIAVVALIAAGIFWLARMSNSTGLPDSMEAAARRGAANERPTASLSGQPLAGSGADSAVTNGEPASAKPVIKRGRIEKAAAQRLASVVEAYAQMTAYEDVTRMQLRYPVGNPAAGGTQIREENAELSFKFERPNKLRLEVVKEAHRVVVTCDGENWRARILDPTTNNFDNQFVTTKFADPATVNALYSATEYVNMDRPNELLNALMSLPAPLLVSQVAFLFEPASLQRLIDSAYDIRALTPQSMQGRKCERIRIGTEGGSFVFWIDERENTVRRIQFPTADRQPGEQTSRLNKSMLQCDYARIQQPSGFSRETFDLAQPENARVVRNFILPPQRDPSSVIGKKVDDFWFTDLRNERTPSGFWDGKVCLLVWWNNHPACRTALESLASTYATFKDDPRVSMLAVSSIPSTAMSHQEVLSIVNDWDIALPVVRDVEAFGRDKFGVAQAPTVVVLNPDGRVQLQEASAGPDLGVQVQAVMQKVLEGEDLAASYMTYLDGRDVEYQKLLAAASVDPPKLKLEPAAPTLGGPTEPTKFSLRELWSNDLVVAPGNISVVRIGLRPQLLVHSGLDTLAELTAYGSVQNRLTPRTSANDSGNGDTIRMTNVRTATDRTGRTFHLTLAARDGQAHLFDDRWQHVISYPDAEGNSSALAASGEGIQDAQIADLDNDGQLELYVAFDGAGGVHRVNMRGKREWTNESIAPVYSLTVSPDDSGSDFLLVTNDRGSIIPLDDEGAPRKPIEVRSWSIHHLAAAPVKSGSNSGYCGISQMPDGSLVAIGLSPAMTELWSEPLDRGTFQTSIDYVQTASWDGGEPYWLIATPTGAIHVVSQDGTLHDQFQTGKMLRGLAGFEAKGSNILLASTEDGVTAWEVELPQ